MSQCDQIKTTCPYCGVGCGVKASVSDKQIIAIAGDTEHPANFGNLCVKGSALDETMGNSGRLTHPMVNGQQVDWSTAINTVAERLNSIRNEHGPEAIAFYLSGQLLTEDYYVANKLAKGFIGTGHVDTNSRLCMSSAVAGYKRAFGSDAVPCNYEDLEQADLLVLTGSNAAWTHPVLYRRMVSAKESNPNLKIVVIDPRRTATCDIADLHLAIAPGTDSFIFSGLLNFISAEEYVDSRYVQQSTEGFEDALEAVKNLSPSLVAEKTGISEQQLKTFYQWFCQTEKGITFYSQGINQSSTGTDKCNAIINCHLATGKMGKPGMGPFSITGQPNAMGGREVGGLANMLAAHMDYTDESIALVSEFWKTDSISRKPGLKAVDLFDAVANGEIKAVWIMGTNPVVSMPNADKVKAALEQCDTVIVSDCIAQTDTTATANILFPATGWGEKQGTVTNSERRISRQRQLVSPAGEAQHDWWILSKVAQAMGFESAFNYQSPRDVFVEHAKLSGYKNKGTRLFDISGLSQLSQLEYDQLEPIQWPINQENPNGTKRLFADAQFNTSSGKAQFVSVTAELPRQTTNNQFPFALNTGRIRDQWHTMTRTGRAQRLLEHIEHPFVAISPDTAKQFDIREGDLVEVETQQAKVSVLAVLDEGLKAKELFIPIHWNDQFASNARVDSLVADIVDKVSGQPEFKFTPAKIKKLTLTSWAKIVSRTEIQCDDFSYWHRTVLNGQGYIYQVGLEQAFDWESFTANKRLLEQGPPQAYEHYSNTETLDQRFLYYSDQQVEMAIFCHTTADLLPHHKRLKSILEYQETDGYWNLMTEDNAAEDGRLICSCHQVSEQKIVDAITSGCRSTEALGQKLKCGTNCGSCIPELNHLITQTLNLL
ncbi:MAG: molybdopterin-dependent oxidoreductase [Porticoccaceae bacterium]